MNQATPIEVLKTYDAALRENGATGPFVFGSRAVGRDSNDLGGRAAHSGRLARRLPDRTLAQIKGIGSRLRHALCFGGQRLFVQPDSGLVVAVTAGDYASPSTLQGIIPLDIFAGHVLPAITGH